MVSNVSSSCNCCNLHLKIGTLLLTAAACPPGRHPGLVAVLFHFFTLAAGKTSLYWLDCLFAISIFPPGSLNCTELNSCVVYCTQLWYLSTRDWIYQLSSYRGVQRTFVDKGKWIHGRVRGGTDNSKKKSTNQNVKPKILDIVYILQNFKFYYAFWVFISYKLQ